MISSASTLLLATLVFNAASVMGAPIKMDTVESVARSEISTPVQPVARAAIVDVQDNRRRSQLGTVSRRSARIVSERDVPLSDFVEVREPTEAPAPAVEARTMRYPRRVYHDFYLKKREPATSVKETLTWKKVTVHDTPADAKAFHHGGDKAEPTVTLPIPTDLPSVTSTTISVSTVIPDVAATSAAADSTAVPEQVSSAVPTETASPAATDVPAPAASDVPAGASTDASPAPTAEPTAEASSAPAPEPTSAPVDNGAANTDAPVASPTAVTSEAPAAASTDSPAPTATATETPSTDSAAPTATATDSTAPTATATDSAEPTATVTDSSAPTATATDSAAPTATATDGTPAAESTATSTDGTSATTCTPPASTDGASCPPAATSTDAAAETTSSDIPAEERRWVKAASSQSVARRSLAVSGASWASAVRRQFNN